MIQANKHNENIQKELIDLAVALAKEQGHLPSCKFSACTCGKVERVKEVLGKFWTTYWKYREIKS